jgi:long-chain acyl-CoA synthetase
VASGTEDGKEGQAGIQMGGEFHPRADIYDRGARGARSLAALGVERGDVVATFLRNDLPCFEVAIAAATLGAHIVPINWHAKSDEARYILEDCAAKVLVAHTDLLQQIQGAASLGLPTLTVPALASRRAPGQTMIRGDHEWSGWVASHEPWSQPSQIPQYSMNYTSGTTGRPKGVRREPMTEEGRAAVARMFELLRVGPGMRTIVAAPLYHAAPFGYSMAALAAGAFIVLMERFDATEYLHTIEQYRINNLQMVPTMFVRLLKLPDEVRSAVDLSSLEIISHGAAPCPPLVKQAMIEWVGPIIYEFYAASEIGLIATLCSSEEALAHPGTVGRPVEGASTMTANSSP